MTDREILRTISGILRLKPDANGIITEQKQTPSPDVYDEWKYHVINGKIYIKDSAGTEHEWSVRRYIWSKLKLGRVCADYKCQYDNWVEQNGGVPYVETRVVNDNDDGTNPQYSYEFIRRFWSDSDGEQHSLKLIMAEYGMGKSSFCQGVRMLASMEIKELFLNSVAAFPLVFNLNDYRNRDFDEFIQNRLLRDYGMDLDYNTFVELCQTGVFCVVLDAWDQMNDTPKATIVRQNILEFSGLWRAKGRVLITCRRSFYQNQLHNKKGREGDYSEIQRARPYTLCGFGKQSVLQYFESVNANKPKEEQSLPTAEETWVDESWNINSELLSRPLNLRLLARHYDEIAKVYNVRTEKVDTFGFLRIIHDCWREQMGDLIGRRDILKPLVILTLESGLNRGIPIDRYKSEINDDSGWDNVVSALKTFDFVSFDENSNREIEFRLAAYQEFLWAKYVLDELSRKQICDRSNLLHRFMLPPEVRSWVANELRNKADDCLTWQIINTRYRHFVDVGYSCSNAVTLLRDLNREPFYANQFNEMKMDLRFRQLNEADLRGLDLSGADLVQSSLINTDLSFTNLDGADFSGANVSDAVWDEYEHMEKCAFIDDSVVVGTSSGRVLTYNISSRKERIAELANEMIRAITADSFGVYTAAQDGWVGYISKDGELKNAFISTSGLQSLTSGGSGSVYVGADVDGIFRYNWKTGDKQQIIANYTEKSKIADIHYYSNGDEKYIAYINGRKRRLVLVELVGMDEGDMVGNVELNSRGNSFGDICFADDKLIYSVTGRGVYSMPVQEIDISTEERHLLSPVRQIYECKNPVELCWANESREVIIIEKASRRLDVITCISLNQPEKIQQREISWIYGQKNHSVQANSISGFGASSDGRFIALSGEKLIVLKREEEDYYQVVDKPIEAKISCTNTLFKGCIGLSTKQKEIFLERNAII